MVWPRGIWLLLLLLLLPAPPLAAKSAARVVDLMPDHAPRRAARKTLAAEVGRPVKLVDPDPLLLESLRWSVPDPVREECGQNRAKLAAQLAGPAPAGEEPIELIPSLIARAGKLLLDLNLQATLETLARARSLLPCESAILEPGQVRELFVYEAVARFYLNDGTHHDAFLELLAVDPRQFLEPDYPPRVRAAFDKAWRAHTKLDKVPVDLSGLEGAVFIDGRPAGRTRALFPGRHVIQVWGLLGEVRTAVLSLAPRESRRDRTPVIVVEAAGFGFPRLELVRAELAGGLAKRQLEPHQAAGLDRYLARVKRTRLLLAVDPGAEGGSMLRGWQPGVGFALTDRAWIDAWLEESR